MPRLLRLIKRGTKTVPRPIENCPASRTVADYRNETYELFVDESFREFFGLDDPSGYFCYAAFALPRKEYDLFKRALNKVFLEYEAFVVGDSGTKLREFKFEDFRRLERSQREHIARRISKLMKTYGGFFIGFFTHTKGFVMERVRSEYVGLQPEVPTDHTQAYDDACSHLRKELQGVGASSVIARVLRNPLLATAQFLHYFKCSFQVLCDPREGKEDKAVQAVIDNFMRDHFARVAPDEAAAYLGMDNTRESHAEPGLQIADLLAGEVRMLFEQHPELLNFGSNSKIIDMESREDMEWWESAAGVFQKLGSVQQLPPEILRVLHETDGTSCLSLYRHSLAAGLITCYSDFGQPRHLEVFEGNVFHQTD